MVTTEKNNPLSSTSSNDAKNTMPREIFLVQEMSLVRQVETDDVWKWLASGWDDLRANTFVSVSYAALFVLLGFVLSFGFYYMGWPYLILPALTGFLLVGPAVGIGFYEISRERRLNRKSSFLSVMTAARHNKLGIFGLGVALAFLFQIWIRISFTVFALNFPGIMPDWEIILHRTFSAEGIYFGIAIALIGAFFATAIFLVGAFSMPMMMDRGTILLPSLITSAYAVLQNKNAMILWAAIIVIFTGIGLLTAGIALIVTLPLIGHATWHAYNQVIKDKAE